jgi:hypothetical protein
VRSQSRHVASRDRRDGQSAEAAESDGGVAPDAVQVQGLLHASLGSPGIAPELERHALDGESETEAILIALATEGRDTLLAEPFGLREISLHHRQRGQAAEPSSHTRGIVQFPLDAEALLEERSRCRIVVLAPGQAARPGQSGGTETSILRRRPPVEHLIDPRATFGDTSSERPRGGERRGQPKPEVVGPAPGPGERRSKVGVVVLQAIEDRGRVPGAQLGIGPERDLEIVLGVPASAVLE